MSVNIWTTEKPADQARLSLMRRLALGPALILALCVGSSGVLALALLLASILEF